MVNVEKEAFFNQSFVDAMTTLRKINNTRDLDLKAKLINFKNEKVSHTKFFLNQIPGSMGRRGSAASEQNNSSLIVCLNDGNNKDYMFFADPHTLTNKTLQRHRVRTNLTNYLLFSQCRKMNVELRRLEALPMKTACDNMFFEAAKVLSRNSYERFLVNVKRSK